MELYCKDCWNFGRCSACGRTVEFAVSDGVCRDFDECNPITNADRIRAMSDEELATTIHAIKLGWTGLWCDYHCENEGDDGCDKCIETWLKQPAEGVDND